MKKIIAGIGNPVRRDDGVGLKVAEAAGKLLAGREEVEVALFWAGGLRLAEALVGFDRAVVVDAMATGRAPGTVERLTLESARGLRTIDCMHDMALADALELLKRAGEKLPDEIVIIGIEAADTDTLDENLTLAVEKAVPEAVEAVVNALEGIK